MLEAARRGGHFRPHGAVRLLRNAGIDPFQANSALEMVSSADSPPGMSQSRELALSGGAKLPQTVKPAGLPTVEDRTTEAPLRFLLESIPGLKTIHISPHHGHVVVNIGCPHKVRSREQLAGRDPVKVRRLTSHV